MRDSPASQLLAWYDQHARTLPWRAKGGEVADPYHVWLSEIMLQQTTVATVKPYFEKFLHLFPTVEALASARDEQVMAAWAGLGYYSRARNLLKCARQIVSDYGGQFPDNEDALLALPGIGPYTAAAVAAIAFNQPAAPVDGNIERVLARITADTTPLPDLKKVLKSVCQSMVPDYRPGDFAQAAQLRGLPVAPELPRPATTNRRYAAASGTKKTQARAGRYRVLAGKPQSRSADGTAPR